MVEATAGCPRSLGRAPRGSGRDISLLCLPYAGGASRSYDSWLSLLPRTIDAQTIRVPGREIRMDEPLPVDLRALAADLVSEIEDVIPPVWAVFGHSMGALLAFELVREVRRRHGTEPSCLIVSGMRSPEKTASMRKYEHLDDAELIEELRRMGGTDAAVFDDPDLWELLGPIMRSDLVMCDHYVFKDDEPLSCPVVAIGSDGDDELDQRLLDGWGEHTSGSFETRMFPGNHFYFLDDPDALARTVIRSAYHHGIR